MRLRDRVREAIAQIELGWMTATLAIPGKSIQRGIRLPRADGNEPDMSVAHDMSGLGSTRSVR